MEIPGLLKIDPLTCSEWPVDPNTLTTILQNFPQPHNTLIGGLPVNKFLRAH